MQEGISGKIGTFHQLKTNDFDDGGLDDHWGLQFFSHSKRRRTTNYCPDG
jgi:hypothetical protein